MNLGMLKLFRIFLVVLFMQNLFASSKDFQFDLIKKGEENNNTLLVIGGIQGDEPGGFTAASLIATHYKILKGSVWVVPNLNFYSIIRRSRGPYGDMNRKFAHISKNDPDYKAVQRIKKYIMADNVKLVLNLHDGSGFYRKKYVDSIHSPYRWGQSSIIDQPKLDVKMYGNLEDISRMVCDHINDNLIRKRDKYSVKDTQTRLGDKEMEKSLTYFSINNGKAAFANEASKNLPVNERTYYHLLALEKYMDIMGIKYERKFKLKPKELKDVIDNDIYISFYKDKIQLPLREVRHIIRYFPIKKNGTIDFKPSNPLVAIIKHNNSYVIHYGNRKLSSLKADYFDVDNYDKSIDFNVDGKNKKISLGSIINVKKSFKVQPIDGYRVNVIGFVKKGKKDEAGILIRKNRIQRRFSVDKKGKIFRVEFYKKDKFAGMILVNFDKKIKLNDEGSSLVINEKNSITSSL